MDIDQQATALRKKLEQIKFKLDNPDLIATKRKQLEDQVDAINAQLKTFEQQLTPLGVMKIKRTMHQWGRYHSRKGKAFPGLCTGKAIQWAA